jgi:hypothetical protein
MLQFSRYGISLAALPLMLALSTSACGSDESEPKIDRTSAALLVGEATTRAQLDVDSFQASGGQAQASFTCASGGSANASGAIAIAPEPLTVNVDVALAYASCNTNQNVVIDGALDFSQQVIVGGESLVYVETILVGRADFSGAHEASCDIDLNVKLDSSTGAIVTAEGSACGYSASELNLNLRKNW